MIQAYRITSMAGVDHGVYIGKTPVHALCSMHCDAGYCVTVESDPTHPHDPYLVFTNQADAAVCGDIEDWTVEVTTVDLQTRADILNAHRAKHGLPPAFSVPGSVAE